MLDLIKACDSITMSMGHNKNKIIRKIQNSRFQLFDWIAIWTIDATAACKNQVSGLHAELSARCC